MIHHDDRPYEVAVSETAKRFQQKLEGLIHGSVKRVAGVIHQVQEDVPTDAIVLGKRMDFTANDEGIVLRGVEAKPLKIHQHALDQLADRTNIRNFRSVSNELIKQGAWGRTLLADNLSTIYRNADGEDRYLLRSVRGQLRGFLSNKFRRLDSRPLLDAFIAAVQRFGARPIDGFALDTKVSIRAIIPMVFEPFPGEILAFGADLSDSDFGDGALSLSAFVLRVWCTNLAQTEDVLRRAHLGKRLDDNVEFSKRTLRLDTETMASAVDDVAGKVLSVKAVNGYLSMVKEANVQKVPTSEITSWVKKHLNKTEQEKVIEKFAGPDIEMLPAGQTKWRFSNAISWLANEVEDEHRRLELQAMAGNVLIEKKTVGPDPGGPIAPGRRGPWDDRHKVKAVAA